MIVPLCDRRHFAELQRRGQQGRCGPIRVRALVSPADSADDTVRVAFAIGRRVGNAVTRNKVRRRLRAVVRSLAGGPEPLLGPGKYLFSTSPDVTDLSFQELTNAVVEALGALGANDRSRSRR